MYLVLSGFLISLLLVHEATTTGRIRVGNFYAFRARRILTRITDISEFRYRPHSLCLIPRPWGG
ncbi:hypothetical protein DDE18_04655 [Nocardioides gansuensis]|uniref:Uncharacterized protein n=1 Tax=Nocardioides gansuensis TaxID=2138300 RepID=A0A2T8FD48_9ACTN|nr:hypothetical protein DDE18_04655 [Nocardioides gansuensis]